MAALDSGAVARSDSHKKDGWARSGEGITAMNELIAAFNQYFRVIPADTPRLLHEVFRLRYQVYCEDTRLADGQLFPEHLERDDYDNRSTHILLQHYPSGHFVGTMRLVLPDPVDPRKPFPAEELARLDPEVIGVPAPLRRHIAEISRFAILHNFPHHQPRRAPVHYERRRVPRYTPTATDNERQKPRLRFPHPMLALVVGMMRTSLQHEITHWYAVMAPSLHRLLHHFGLSLRVVGPRFQFHGLRRPHFDSIQNVMDKAYWGHPEIWELVTESGALCPRPSIAAKRLLAIGK